jgi:SAM-dependent methyltransferase
MTDTGITVTRNHPRTFADILNRAWALETDVVKRLLEVLPSSIREAFQSCYLDGDIESREAQQLLDYLCVHSAISRIIRQNPGSSLAFEYLYRKAEPGGPIDCYYLESLAGRHVEKRLATLEKNLPGWLARLCGEKTVLVDNMGSGPGHDMVHVFKSAPVLAGHFHVRNIDSDEEALRIGQKTVQALGMSDTFSFCCSDLRKAAPREADVILLIGILCSLPMDIHIRLLRQMKSFCRPGGLIFSSTNQVAMVEKDPFTDFLMRLAGWQMAYKTDEEVAQAAVCAGWEYVDQFFDDDLHFQCITVARC